MADSRGTDDPITNSVSKQRDCECLGGVVRVEDSRPEGYDGTCLRPLGLCELGGSCDACWYSPDHPRFQNRSDG